MASSFHVFMTIEIDDKFNRLTFGDEMYSSVDDETRSPDLLNSFHLPMRVDWCLRFSQFNRLSLGHPSALWDPYGSILIKVDCIKD